MRLSYRYALILRPACIDSVKPRTRMQVRWLAATDQLLRLAPDCYRRAAVAKVTFPTGAAAPGVCRPVKPLQGRIRTLTCSTKPREQQSQGTGEVR